MPVRVDDQPFTFIPSSLEVDSHDEEFENIRQFLRRTANETRERREVTNRCLEEINNMLYVPDPNNPSQRVSLADVVREQNIRDQAITARQQAEVEETHRRIEAALARSRACHEEWNRYQASVVERERLNADSQRESQPIGLVDTINIPDRGSAVQEQLNLENETVSQAFNFFSPFRYFFNFFEKIIQAIRDAIHF